MSAPKPNLPEPSPKVPAPPRLQSREGAPGWRSAPPALPPGLASGPDLGGLLRAFRRRWMLAITLGILAAGAAGAAAYYLLPPKQTAFAQVHLLSQHPYFVFRDAESSRGEFLTFQGTQAARLKSRFVLNAALKRDEVRLLPEVQAQSDPVVWLEDELKVETKEGSEFMTLSMSGSDPTTLLPIVNAVIHCYLQDITEEEPRLKGQRLADLDEILTKASIRVKKKKDLFKQRAEELGTSDAPAVVQKQVNVLTSLGEYRGQHARVAGDLMKAQSKLKTHQAQEKLFLDPAVPESIISEAAEADPVSKQMLQRLDRIREVAEDYERNATNPAGEGTYRKAKDQMASVRKALDVRLGKLREEVTKRYKQKAKSDYDAILAQLQSEVTLAADNERSVREQVETLVKEAEKIGRSSTELEQLRAEIQTEEKTLSQVGEERQKLDVELRAPPRVRLQQEAGLQKKDVKKQILALIAAPVLAFALVCFLVCWFEFRARRIQSTEEVSTGLGMRVVGSVPALSLPRRPISDDEEDMEEHHLLESIDGIRTLLLRDDSVESTRVVMVTSAVSGEGKTTLASHLASSLARAGRKTLLIDSDLRRPAAHQLFELPLQPGLSEVLLSEAHVAEATRSTSVDGLWVMPAGQWDRDVMHALARDGMEEIVRKLKAKYDFIVIDSHPVLPANDALLVGQHADAVLLSLLRDVSQAPRVYAACQRLNTLGIRILGAVVNGIRQEDYSSGYQYAAPAARG